MALVRLEIILNMPAYDLKTLSDNTRMFVEDDGKLLCNALSQFGTALKIAKEKQRCPCIVLNEDDITKYGFLASAFFTDEKWEIPPYIWIFD